MNTDTERMLAEVAAEDPEKAAVLRRLATFPPALLDWLATTIGAALEAHPGATGPELRAILDALPPPPLSLRERL